MSIIKIHLFKSQMLFTWIHSNLYNMKFGKSETLNRYFVQISLSKKIIYNGLFKCFYFIIDK